MKGEKAVEGQSKRRSGVQKDAESRRTQVLDVLRDRNAHRKRKNSQDFKVKLTEALIKLN